MAEEQDSPREEKSPDTGEDEELWDSTPDLDEEEEETEEEEPGHDYEKRYKDLEREFHKRNEDSARQRDEFQEMRLQNLELKRQLEEFQTQPTAKADKAKSKRSFL